MRITLYIFIFIYSATAFRSVIPLLEYGFNYEYIANELCVNKAKKASTCNGKCHLKKELSKTAEDHEEKNTTSKQKINEIDFLYECEITIASAAQYFLPEQIHAAIIKHTLTGHLHTFSPPPLFS